MEAFSHLKRPEPLKLLRHLAIVNIENDKQNKPHSHTDTCTHTHTYIGKNYR